MRGLLAATLVFEGLVVLFATLVAKDLSDVNSTTVWWVGGVAALACLVLAGFLRHPWALVVGSVLQLLLIVSGVVVPTMFFLGVIFAGLWFLAIYLGRRVERLQAEPRPK
ncbi:MAG: DUF4233 domain-containing protein [Actinomycetes bacterium]